MAKAAKQAATVDDVWADAAPETETKTSTEAVTTAQAPEAPLTSVPETVTSPSVDADAPANQTTQEAPRKRGRPAGSGTGTSKPVTQKTHQEMSLSELGKALTKALDKAKAGREALEEAETINAEIAKRLG